MRELLVAALLLVACGDDAARPDGGGGDGGGDGDAGVDADIDADPGVRGPVTVHIVDKTGAPIAGLHVVFIDTDQTVTDVLTDAAGAAGAMVYPGASLTAVRARDTNMAFSLTTVKSLVPGDDVKLFSAPSSVVNGDDAMSVRIVPLDTTPAGTFTFNYATYAGAQKYIVYTSCGATDVGPTLTPAISFSTGCVRDPMDVVVVAAMNSGAPLAYTEKAAIAFTAGGSTTITDTWHSLASLTATYTNPTAAVTDIEVERYAPYVRGLPAAQASDSTTGGPTSLIMNASLPTAAVMKTRLSCPFGASSGCASTMAGGVGQTITQTVDGTSASYALDIGANLLPWVTADYDPATTTLSITVTGSGTYDLFEANIRYNGHVSEPIRGQTIYTWRVFGPIAGDITFPTLPSMLPGDPTLRPTDAVGAHNVYLCETDTVGGYRNAIKSPYETLGTCDASPSSFGPTATKLYGGGVHRLSRWN